MKENTNTKQPKGELLANLPVPPKQSAQSQKIEGKRLDAERPLQG